MATYEQLNVAYFYVRYPRRFASVADFEAEPGEEDRAITERLFGKMAIEAPTTARIEFGIDYFPDTSECFAILDEFLTPEIADRWIAESDPEDENNHLKLNVCELAVHVGNVIVREFHGEWRYARYPNFFNSTVLLAHIEVHVFDMLLKKCSDDYRHENIAEKVAEAVRLNRLGNMN
jgi:hypothetical protein